MITTLQAYELSTLTGTQVMLLVASETGHVYTFATRKLQPMITSDAGKALIQTCLNSPDLSGNGTGHQSSMSTTPDVVQTNGHLSTLIGGISNPATSNNVSSMNHENMFNTQSTHTPNNNVASLPNGTVSGCSTPSTVIDQRMSAAGFEETDISYSVSNGDCSPLNDKVRIVVMCGECKTLQNLHYLSLKLTFLSFIFYTFSNLIS